MQIKNISKEVLLAKEVHLASSWSQRLKGLLGRAYLPYEEALIIQPCNSVHTFFMRFSIDVIFIDKKGRVVRILPNLSPFRISGLYFRAFSAIELCAGTIYKTNTEEGDLLQILP